MQRRFGLLFFYCFNAGRTMFYWWQSIQSNFPFLYKIVVMPFCISGTWHWLQFTFKCAPSNLNLVLSWLKLLVSHLSKPWHRLQLVMPFSSNCVPCLLSWQLTHCWFSPANFCTFFPSTTSKWQELQFMETCFPTKSNDVCLWSNAIYFCHYFLFFSLLQWICQDEFSLLLFRTIWV